MFGRKNTKILLCILLLLFILTAPACKTGEKVPKEMKEEQKAEMEAEKAAEMEYQEALKHHQSIQSKKTRESAKLLKKEQKKINHSKKRSLWDRLFNNKCYQKPR